MANDVLLTGPGRSGTTLVCHLLNELPDTVALNEPLVPRHFLQGDPVENVAAFFARQRTRIAETGTAVSCSVDGALTSNPVADRRTGVARLLSHVPGKFAATHLGKYATREVIATRGPMEIGKDLADDYMLLIKQPGALTALLEPLATRFASYAIVRNPLAILASWNSVDFRADGHAPVPELLDADLKARLSANRDRFDRQIELLAWGFERYLKFLPPEHLLTYEALVESGGPSLAVITPRAASLAGSLQNRNRNKVYDRRLVPMLAERLLSRDEPFWQVYTRESVEQLAIDYAGRA
jgi:hypothetical protein